MLFVLWIWFWLALLVVAGVWLVARFYLSGPDLSAQVRDTGERFSGGPQPGPEHLKVLASLGNMRQLVDGVPLSKRTQTLRQYMDHMFDDRAFNTSFTPVDAGGVAAEWVRAAGADGTRRLLYIHGGAWIMGSPRSHRTLTSRLAELTGGVVLAIDYRLMPEHRRIAGIEDCRTAYRWMLDHGPDADAPASAVFVAGDSAGGNLTLSLINWVRDQGLRAPDAAVALSPATDATMSGPSVRSNVKTDAMLGPLMGKLAKVPAPLLLWGGWANTRINPRDPVVSPLFADLSGLPPVLVQVSTAEMLYDDARRYVNRAQAAGSPAQLQSWDHMVHVWQIFNPQLPEANQALEEIGKFLNAAAPVSKPPLPATSTAIGST